MRAIRCSGEVRVAQPPEAAVLQFTAEGERAWAPGWDPIYPAGSGDAPGTVFQTSAHGREVTWVIVERTPTTAAYARIVPGVQAGIVAVRCRPDGDGTVAAVTYELTALSDEAAAELDHFEAAYPAMLAEWQQRIAAALST